MLVTIQRFLAQINQGEGFARTNRYIVRINPPVTKKIGNFGANRRYVRYDTKVKMN